MTHILLESGPRLMGTFFDQGLVDEVHVFVAPKIVGGTAAIAPIGGQGLSEIPQFPSITGMSRRFCGTDVLIEGRVTNLVPAAWNLSGETR
jgi:diaminohydroxyphosphoribosylaminopyrimidine deaminase/5-amino-6-(5-phosphoribosylamino)uracil reductase